MKEKIKSITIVGLLVVGTAVLAVFPLRADAENLESSCWGQASAVFARMGGMGEHSSSFPTPRLGLRNLARQLFYAGVIPDDSMAALGVFGAEELGLEIDACE